MRNRTFIAALIAASMCLALAGCNTSCNAPEQASVETTASEKDSVSSEEKNDNKKTNEETDEDSESSALITTDDEEEGPATESGEGKVDEGNKTTSAADKTGSNGTTTDKTNNASGSTSSTKVNSSTSASNTKPSTGTTSGTKPSSSTAASGSTKPSGTTAASNSTTASGTTKPTSAPTTSTTAAPKPTTSTTAAPTPTTAPTVAPTTAAPTPTTAAPTTAPTVAPTQHQHTWVEQTTLVHHDATYETVHHDEVGHNEESPIMEEYVVCNHCGGDMAVGFDGGGHVCPDGVYSGAWHTGERQIGTETIYVVDSRAWDETVMVIAPYDELVVTGYKCSTCGATK